MDLKMLKILVQMLNLTAVGHKDELITIVTQFLFNPQPTGNPFIKPGAKLKKKKATPKKKSVKKKRKPKSTGPKRPPNAYMLFANANRARVREENPDLKITEVAKKLGDSWKTIPQEEKQTFLDKAKRLKQEYNEKYPKEKKSKKKHQKRRNHQKKGKQPKKQKVKTKKHQTK